MSITDMNWGKSESRGPDGSDTSDIGHSAVGDPNPGGAACIGSYPVQVALRYIHAVYSLVDITSYIH